MPVLSLACHLPHNTPHIPSRYNNEQTTKQTKAINNSYLYWLAKGNAHRVNNGFSDKAAWELSHTNATMPLMNCARVWYRTDQESGNLIGREPGLSFVYLQSLLISLIKICVTIYVIWNRKLITAQLSTENTSCFNFFVYFFFNSVPPVFQHGAPLVYINISCKCDTNRAGHFTLDAYASRPVACFSSGENSHD